MGNPEITLGIDLAAQPENTAACRLIWTGESATVDDVVVGRPGCGDNELVAMMRSVVGAGGTVAIDAPFGWPDAFVEQLIEYRDSGRWSTGEKSRDLCWRTTDLALKNPEGGDGKIHPLSVSTDRIGVVAMRCAHLLARLASDGITRDPLGRQVVEVYPGGALRRWGLNATGYKQSPERRSELLGQPPLTAIGLASFRDQIVATDHAFDALVSAIVARDVALGRDDKRPDVGDDQLRREGWIRMPLARQAK